MDIDYLILGTGLSALTFGALMAKSGQKVLMLEAHDLPGGYGHTFIEQNNSKEYHFNAQFHYVWDCGVGDPVYQVLQKLGLEKEVSFLQYDTNGFDRMRMPGYSLDIPNDYDQLTERLSLLFPANRAEITAFISTIEALAKLLVQTKVPLGVSPLVHYVKNWGTARLLKYYRATLQDVFDEFKLPKAAQTLLASQWPDFLLPPKQLSFYCWLVLFDGYLRGAYYPTHHFEHVINSLVDVINQHQGQIIYNQTVIEFLPEHPRMRGVVARNTLDCTAHTTYEAKNIICNMDPRTAAQLIGMQYFPTKMQKKLNYDYSPSNLIVYGAVKDLDLSQHGFGKWNIFHSEQLCLNQSFDEMYQHGDYSKLSFGMATPSLISPDTTGCPEGEQLFALLTVANYSWFKQLKYRNAKDYIQAKKQIYNTMLDVIERDYVPGFRDHVSFKMIGSPTTNASYCWSPEGNSYGANMTPKNMGLFKLSYFTPFANFYFCNASAGYAGFAKSFNNGAILYEHLTQDRVFQA